MKVLEKIQKENKLIKASCNGKGECGLCKILIKNYSAPISKEEAKLLSENELNNNVRLACKQEYSEDLEYEIINNNYHILDDIKYSKLKIKKASGIGACLDIGTTTIVLKIVNLNDGSILKSFSFLNPQSTYGADVITRISYDNEHLGILHKVLIDELSKYLQEYPIKKLVVSGNTTMLHLFLNEKVEALGHLPFELIVKNARKFNSSLLFKNTNFEIYTFPNISAFVGGDIVAGIYAFDLDFKNDKFLFIDLGTNGEMVIGDKNNLLCTSCAAGPSFEAVGISNGGPSVDGAIYEVSIDKTVIVKTINNKKANCICGSGLISLIAELRRKNIIDKKGRLKDNKLFYLTNDISISNKDIQTFLLAKAAVQVAVSQLLKKEKISNIYLSGGFSKALKSEDLAILKILPTDCSITNLSNSSLAGAYRYLLEGDDNRINEIAQKMKNINLAQCNNFDDDYIKALYI